MEDKMSKITLEIHDEDLLQLGEAKIKEELEHALRLIKMKGLLRDISAALSSLKVDYEKEIDVIKEESWKEYKKDLP